MVSISIVGLTFLNKKCEQIAHEQWQMFEQKELCKQGA